MIYTFDGNNVKAPTPDTSNSDMGNEVIHTYEDFNEEEEDFAPIKKPGFFQSRRRSAKAKAQMENDDMTSKSLDEINNNHGAFKDVDPEYQKSFLNAVNEIPVSTNKNEPENSPVNDSTPVSETTPVNDQAPVTDSAPANESTLFTEPAPANDAPSIENGPESITFNNTPETNTFTFGPSQEPASSEASSSDENTLSYNNPSEATYDFNSEPVDTGSSQVFDFSSSVEETPSETPSSESETVESSNEETETTDAPETASSYDSESNVHVYNFDAEPAAPVSFASTIETPVEPETPAETETASEPETSDSSSYVTSFETEPVSDEPEESNDESSAVETDTISAETEDTSTEESSETSSAYDFSSTPSYSVPETSEETTSVAENTFEDTTAETSSEPETESISTESESEPVSSESETDSTSTESAPEYSYTDYSTTDNAEETNDMTTTDETTSSTDLSEDTPAITDDMLLTQIDAFKKNAIKLSGLMSQKQKAVSDLEDVVSRKEEQNKQLTESLERAKQDSAVIEDQLNSQVGKIIDSLNTSIGGMKQDFINSKEESDKNLLAKIESNGSLDEVKTDISDIIHNENVEQYRNIQKLISENNNSEEIMSSIKRYMKGMETKLSIAVTFTIINFLGILGILLHLFGTF